MRRKLGRGAVGSKLSRGGESDAAREGVQQNAAARKKYKNKRTNRKIVPKIMIANRLSYMKNARTVITAKRMDRDSRMRRVDPKKPILLPVSSEVALWWVFNDASKIGLNTKGDSSNYTITEITCIFERNNISQKAAEHVCIVFSLGY
uniref:40S ribosomal protein S25 n=1 Tax=Haemonchus contortus TaxID=6289 RepID=A0A7I4Y541_HAECO